jgi:hypothetical protein
MAWSGRRIFPPKKQAGKCGGKTIRMSLGDVQSLPWDSKDKEIFAMLDDICIICKQAKCDVF